MHAVTSQRLTHTINIDDNTNPTITGSIAATNVEGCNISAAPAPAATVAALEAMGLTISDACTPDASLVVTSSDSNAGTCPIVITRTYRVTDACGNFTTVAHTINIDDNTNPTITGSIAVTNVEGCNISAAPAPAATVAALEAMGLTISDACTPDASLVVTSSDSNAGTCPIVITRTYRVTDACSNYSTATHTINIDDNTNPTASNPAPVTVQCIGDVPVPDITVVTDEADNCTVNPVVAFVSDASDGNSCPEVITRTYSVTDACGNTINVTQTITIDDTTNPTASNPAPVTVQCIGDVPAPDITVVTDEADNCTVNPVVAFVSDAV